MLLAVVIRLQKNLFGSACSGQYFMSEIELKRWSKFCLQWSFVGLKSVWFVVLLAVASTLFWDGIKKEIEVLLAVVICWLKICLVLLAVAIILVFYVWDSIKKGIKVLLAVVICWLKICLVLLAVASILSEIELKIAVLLAVVICLLKICLVCGSACSGQYFVWDRIKKNIAVLLAVVICWLKVCFVLLAVASILCLR